MTKNTESKAIIIIYAICAITLIIGCFRIPIGYYTFLRIVVFVASIVWVVMHIKDSLSIKNIVSALICILFNPIIPVYLHNKNIWIVIDALAAAWFVYLAIISLKKNCSIYS